MNAPYPWQTEHWQGLWQAHRGQRLAHALLLCGPDGLGVGDFARALAQGLLCTSPDAAGLACKTCRSCVLFRAGSHPDLYALGPEPPSRFIRIEQVRDVIGFAGLTSQASSKVMLIDPADVMNAHAANALLKTLEEPPRGSLFILVTDRPAALPVTLRSRCQRSDFAPPTRAEALDWLCTQGIDAARVEPLVALSGNRPLLALERIENGYLDTRTTLIQDLEGLVQQRLDPLAIADRWAKLSPALVLPILAAAVRDRVVLSLAGSERIPGCAGSGAPATEDVRGLLDTYARIERARGVIDGGANVLPLNLYEELTITWGQPSAGDRRS
ncbi:MAG: DNA polymerase III subunit delta' [Gammaproteobacteria bacterium]